MSFQFQPPSITTQPLVVDPSTAVNRPPLGSHSDGSFGTVFIILAVIVVISAAACCLGRFCNKYHEDPRPSKQKRHSNRKESDDIEFGFDRKMRMPSVKSARHGEFRGHKPSIDMGFQNENKAADDVEPRAGP